MDFYQRLDIFEGIAKVIEEFNLSAYGSSEVQENQQKYSKFFLSRAFEPVIH